MKTIFEEHRPAIQRDYQLQLEISLRCELADTDIYLVTVRFPLFQPGDERV